MKNSLQIIFRKAIRRLLRGSAPQALAAGDCAPLQRYAGYEDSDMALLDSYATAAATLSGDRYQDGFGVTTLLACVPFVEPATLDPARLKRPVPDDGFHAEAIEYLALLDAIQRARGSQGFCAVEIGAGWGPWIGAAGVIARRCGVAEITLVGVEAATERFPLLRLHLETNGLRPPGVAENDARSGGVLTRLFQGAIWTHDGEIWFPASDVADMGAAAASDASATDYRGAPARHQAVACQRLDTLLGDIERIDFMHIDIQGAEFDLLDDQIHWLNQHVATLMLATHSRPIEGRLIDLMLRHGWRLHREKPCRVDWPRECPLVGRTVADGSQYWLNPGLLA
ncbi:MAG: FkbM family methyltransferase [Rhodocyclaceae bacterium]